MARPFREWVGCFGLPAERVRRCAKRLQFSKSTLVRTAAAWLDWTQGNPKTRLVPSGCRVCSRRRRTGCSSRAPHRLMRRCKEENPDAEARMSSTRFTTPSVPNGGRVPDGQYQPYPSHISRRNMRRARSGGTLSYIAISPSRWQRRSSFPLPHGRRQRPFGQWPLPAATPPVRVNRNSR